jgi:hypothetical protein
MEMFALLFPKYKVCLTCREIRADLEGIDTPLSSGTLPPHHFWISPRLCCCRAFPFLFGSLEMCFFTVPSHWLQASAPRPVLGRPSHPHRDKL